MAEAVADVVVGEGVVDAAGVVVVVLLVGKVSAATDEVEEVEAGVVEVVLSVRLVKADVELVVLPDAAEEPEPVTELEPVAEPVLLLAGRPLPPT